MHEGMACTYRASFREAIFTQRGEPSVQHEAAQNALGLPVLQADTFLVSMTIDAQSSGCLAAERWIWLSQSTDCQCSSGLKWRRGGYSTD